MYLYKTAADVANALCEHAVSPQNGYTMLQQSHSTQTSVAETGPRLEELTAAYMQSCTG